MNLINLACLTAFRSWEILRFSQYLKISQLWTVSIYDRMIRLIYMRGVLKSSDQALFHSVQQKNRRCDIKEDMFWQSWGVFQSDEKISQKIYQKNPWKYFFVIFFFSNSNPESILRRYHLTTIWYLHFPTHTSFAFPKKKQHRMNVFSLLVLLAHM